MPSHTLLCYLLRFDGLNAKSAKELSEGKQLSVSAYLREFLEPGMST